METRPAGKPRQRWQEDVMEDLKNWKSKTGRRQLRIEELGETWLRRRKPTKGCSVQWWWWWWWWCAQLSKCCYLVSNAMGWLIQRDKRNQLSVQGIEPRFLWCPARDLVTIPTVPTPFNPLNAELNPICHLLALWGAHHILHVSGIMVKRLSNAEMLEYFN